MKKFATVLALALLPFVAAAQPSMESAPPPQPKVSVRFVPEFGATAPGGTVTLAAEIKLEKSWHTYHPIYGETGRPTTLEFRAPAGVTFGHVQFPAPEAREYQDIHYLGYEGAFP